MEKLITGRQSHIQLWSVVLVSFVFCLVLLCLDYSVLPSTKNGVSSLVYIFSDALNTTKTTQLVAMDKPCETTAPPAMFTGNKDKIQVEVQDVADQQYSSSDWKREDPCSGIGPKVENPQGVLSDRSWFETNQFLLEVIFHQRMKQYKCLTNDSSLASAFFVPYYAGLDVGRYLWGYNTSVRDSSAYDVVNWLGKKAEWKRMWGRDHFFVAGRIAWDFRRQTGNQSDWGNRLMSLPESMNMTMLSIESSSWSNEFAIPYPTYFHPSSDSEVISWQKRVRSRKRRYLFSFAGAPRPTMNDSIRGEIINQCLASKKTCNFLDCRFGGNKCDTPVEVIKVFRDSIFCLQPPGDSYTRRSTFDSIMAGCIPVFFHPYSAYAQYVWYFPKNYTKYSVYIPANNIKDGRVSINEVLSRFSKGQVSAMRKGVVKLIPMVIYADPRSRLERFEDAFDIAVKRVLERVEKVRKDVKEGKDPSVDFAVENHWKLKLSGIVGDHPLDQFF
ncbi:probable xyloglucan galactosyltransferase GT14 isoform X2 [Durio zibethinus]|uniref:Probable xyloglucan galactosyltransferase GT14 isoform X2 n=1 Tax=Durio zibethinus TaxID=66656 RepID=A0A6P6A7X2_DURZI|nr:probable xyloglucan galactosyltransferase GT14 isoform X2 [Durio zibethinus]